MSLLALARLLGVKRHQAEDALHSERAARAVLSRRELFAASGALAAGTAFSFSQPARVVLPKSLWATLDLAAQINVNLVYRLAWATLLPFEVISGGETEQELFLRVRGELQVITERALAR